MQDDSSKRVVMIEIYLGPEYRTPDGKREAYRKIDRAHKECLMTTGGTDEKGSAMYGYGCDLIYGVFFQSDNRTAEFAEELNGLDHITFADNS